MITFKTGNLLESNAEALVNTVNTVGVMGKGVALQFKKQFPHNAKVYEAACKEKSLDIGKLLVVRDESMLGGKKLIINFPTKTDWRKPSEYSYIEEGLKSLVNIIHEYQIQSIAIPPLGAGNGGLDWIRVKQMIIKYLGDLPLDITLYEPSAQIQEVLKKERVKLTPARAMLLYVLFDLVKNGEFVSEFAAEKVAYFLQKFGAREEFKLTFSENFYGPYSGKVKHVLYYLNGSYISGYSSKDRKPFEELGIMMDAEADVNAFLEKPGNEQFRKIAEKTKSFLSGFYSSFALELLSTIDFIIINKQAGTSEEINAYLHSWSERKRTMFSNPEYISLALAKLKTV